LQTATLSIHQTQFPQNIKYIRMISEGSCKTEDWSKKLDFKLRSNITKLL